MLTPHETHVAETLRCGELGEAPASLPCGKPATAQRAGDGDDEPRYVCAVHARPTDRPIPADRVYRRVSLTVQIFLPGACVGAGPAEWEASDRVYHALRSVGALVSLIECRSALVRYVAPVAPQDAPTGAGKG